MPRSSNAVLQLMESVCGGVEARGEATSASVESGSDVEGVDNSCSPRRPEVDYPAVPGPPGGCHRELQELSTEEAGDEAGRAASTDR